MKVTDLFGELWKKYCTLNPLALKVHQLLEARGENVLNDHVAFRTFDIEPLGISSIAKVFLEMGYEEKGQYDFEVKKLNAIHLEHEDKTLPKVFISELLTKKFSPEVQKSIQKLVDQIDKKLITDPYFCNMGRLWNVSYEEYQALMQESEYAAWMSAFGFCANHFTVNVNELSTFSGIQDINDFLRENGFKLNESGGDIKGSPEEMLEQSSTLAATHEVNFSNGKHSIPSCYYEFALRYAQSDGELYQGFVAKSADKIFESTNKSQ